jgi:hypothetical protein
MSETVPLGPQTPPGADQRIRAEAVAVLHLLALRRQFDAIRQVFGDTPPHRAREVLWVGLEVLLAHFQGERIALRDLVDRAQGLLSGPTLSRVVTEMEQDDLLLSEPAPDDSRVKLLRPTARTLDVLAGRTEVAFAEFAQVVEDARLRIAAAQSD